MDKKFKLANLLSLSKTETKLLAIGFIALLGGSGITLAFPWLAKEMLNQKTVFDNLVPNILLFTALFAVQAVCFFFRHYAFTMAGLKIVAELRKRLFSNLAFQRAKFFDKERTGDLLSRLSSDCQLMQRAATTSISVLLRYSLQVLFGLVAMFFISVKLSLILCCSIPLFTIAGYLLSKKLRAHSKVVQEALGSAGVIADETISNYRSVKIFQAEKLQNSLYSDAINTSLEAGRSRTLLASVFSSSMVFILHTVLLVVAAYGGYLVQSDLMTIGDLTGFVLYGLIVAVSFAFLTSIWEEFASALAAGERVFELLAEQPEVASSEPLEVSSATVVKFDKVGFTYDSAPENPVLKNISFEIKRGEKVALVGVSGGGKTTIASLIPAFYFPTSGAVEVFGSPAGVQVRSQIAVVTQDPEVFSTTIRENISIANESLSDEEIVHLLKLAQLEDFTTKLDTYVGDKGIRLSGGQKQRLAVARAMAKNPALLILDEATSSLDAENEVLVQRALEELMKERTTLTIAHRLSTVKNADKVLVIEGGEIIQSGSHEELVSKDGTYQNLVSLQLLGVG